MTGKNRRTAALAAPPPDPFGEHHRAAWRERRQSLVAQSEFATDSRALLEIVRAAYARLPAHCPAAPAPRLRVALALTPRCPGAGQRALSGAGILYGAVADAGFIALRSLRAARPAAVA